jgi:hypothetical protein
MVVRAVNQRDADPHDFSEGFGGKETAETAAVDDDVMTSMGLSRPQDPGLARMFPGLRPEREQAHFGQWNCSLLLPMQPLLLGRR